MPIPNNEADNGKELFYTDAFKILVRSEKEILLRGSQTIPIVDRAMLFAFRTDFYRVMRSMNVPAHLRWATAYINDIIDPNQDVSNLHSFQLINESDLNKAIARANTVKA
jgi:hypothetical protein